ncbi:MAG: glycosyltransferase family 4 protein [Pseudomonadota bacterium]|nr:glycosyltransferase family 4 protein [Pseudomonadota bacterium]
MKTKYSVLMFDAAYPPPVFGGKEKQAHILSRELLNNNIRVNVLTYMNSITSNREYESVPVDRVKKNTFSLPVLLFKLIYYRFICNVLHVHTPSTIGKIISLAGAFLRFKVVFKFPNENLLDSKNWFQKYVWSLMMRYVDLFVVLESDTKNKLLSSNVKNEKIFHVANGVRVPEVNVNSDNKTVNIIFVGRLVSQKRCSDLINSCASLRSRCPDWHLTIVGDGPLRVELESLAITSGIGDKVTFTGYQDDTLDYMSAADVLVLPSSKEGMSNVLLEAMSLGLPIITTCVGSSSHQLGNCGLPYLFEVGDVQALCEKLEELIQDKDSRKNYGHCLRMRCIKYFSIHNIAKQYIDQYGRITMKK